MTPNEAAKIIGCDQSHVRRMIRDGRMNATYVEVNNRKFYDVSLEEARRVRERYENENRGRPKK